MHASLVPALGIEVQGWKGPLGTHANYTIPYHTIYNSATFKQYKDLKYKHWKVTKYQKYFCLRLPHVCTGQTKAKSTPACTSSWDANTNNGSGLQRRWLTNCSTMTHVPKELPSSFLHHHKEWAIFNAEHLNIAFSRASQRLQTYARREQWEWVVA